MFALKRACKFQPGTASNQYSNHCEQVEERSRYDRGARQTTCCNYLLIHINTLVTDSLCTRTEMHLIAWFIKLTIKARNNFPCNYLPRNSYFTKELDDANARRLEDTHSFDFNEGKRCDARLPSESCNIAGHVNVFSVVLSDDSVYCINQESLFDVCEITRHLF